MKLLLKIFLTLALGFLSTFVIARLTGILTASQIEAWLTAAMALSPLTVGMIVAGLLFADLFIAVPTLTLCILAGYFIGFPAGAAAALSGTMMAGITGHTLSRKYGHRLITLITKDESKIQEAKSSFQNHGFLMVLIARAAPIVPEVTACLAGMTGMPFPRFLLAWSLSTIPYCLVATYAGSVSTLENPKPAIMAAIGMSGTLWLAWYWFHKKQKRLARTGQ